MHSMPFSLNQLGRYGLLATSLTLAACGGSSSGNNGGGDPAPAAPTITSIALPQAISTTLAPNVATELAQWAASDIQVNGSAASAAQFSNITLTLSGTDAALFNVSKTGEGAASKFTLGFNSAATALEKSSCGGDFVCDAIITAVLEEQTATLAATVNLDFPVTALAINAENITATTGPADHIDLLSINKDLLLVNGIAALEQEFAAATFSLTGANADLFSLEETNSQLTLSFNQNGADIAEGICAENTCIAVLTANYKGQSSSINASIEIDYPIGVILSALLTDEGRYFFFQKADVQPDGVDCGGTICPPNQWLDKEVRLPILPLMVARETGLDGESCAQVVNTDASITAYSANLPQRTAYVENCALTPVELATLNVELVGYTPDQQVTTCQQSASSDGEANCNLDIRQPNNPTHGDTQYNYGLADRIAIESTTTNYFSADGTLASRVTLTLAALSSCLTDNIDYYASEGDIPATLQADINTACGFESAAEADDNLENSQCQQNYLRDNLPDDQQELVFNDGYCPKDNAYTSQSNFYKETLKDQHQPMLVLKYEAYYNFITSTPNMADINWEGSNGNIIYPIDISITGAKTTIPVSVNLVAVDATKALIEREPRKFSPIMWGDNGQSYPSSEQIQEGNSHSNEYHQLQYLIFDDRDDLSPPAIEEIEEDYYLYNRESHIKFTSFHTEYAF